MSALSNLASHLHWGSVLVGVVVAQVLPATVGNAIKTKVAALVAKVKAKV